MRANTVWMLDPNQVFRHWSRRKGVTQSLENPGASGGLNVARSSERRTTRKLRGLAETVHIKMEDHV